MSAVPRRRRYYEGATTSHSASRPLLVRDRVPRGPPRVRARRSAPGRMEEPPEPGPFGPPEARFRLASAWTGWDLTGSQAIHPVPLPGSKTPAESMVPPPKRSHRCCPRAQHGEGFSGHLISRLRQGFGTRCLRFARGVAAARARLASGWLVGLCRERVELSGSRRKVSERSHVVLLSRAYPVASWAHARRKLFEIAELKKAPIAIEAVRRIDALFAIEREINGMTAEDRRAVRAARSRPLVTALEAWLREHRAKLSAKSEVAKAIDYLLKRWPSFAGFVEDGRICLSNNAAERAIRGIAVGRRNWTFAGSDAGGRRAAALYTLIETAKLNDVDPHAWLADVLRRLPDHPALRLHELLPWAWKPSQVRQAAA